MFKKHFQSMLSRDMEDAKKRPNQTSKGKKYIWGYIYMMRLTAD